MVAHTGSVLNLLFSLSLFLSLSPSVFVWKEERGAASLIGEGRRPRCESWGSQRSRTSTFNLSDIIKARLADRQPHRGTRENTLYRIFSLCLSPSSAPFFFSLWNLIFSNTASSFLFISWRYSLCLISAPTLIGHSSSGGVVNELASPC